MITETKIMDCGMEVTKIEVSSTLLGYVSTKIGQYKSDKYCLNINTHPKIFDTNKEFDTIEKAKKYYLEILSIHCEIINNILKGKK